MSATPPPHAAALPAAAPAEDGLPRVESPGGPPGGALLRLIIEEEAARAGLARELHDGVGQTLVAARLLLARFSAGDATVLERIEHLLDGMAIDLHRLGMRLRPLALDELGLGRALPTLLAEWSERTKIAVSVSLPGLEPRLPSAMETILYRILLEALRDIAARADARQVAVSVERGAALVTLTVVDDGARGAGDHEPEPRSHLQAIRERAELIKGRVSAGFAPERGWRLCVEIPLAN